VTEGRRQEFSRFAAFSDEATRARIPDPQAEDTFVASRLQWNEIEVPGHSSVHRLYRALLALRRCEAALRTPDGAAVVALGEHCLAVQRTSNDGGTLLLLVCFRGPATVDARGWAALDAEGLWDVVLTTEDDPFVAMSERGSRDTAQLAVTSDGRAMFRRPGAVILRRR
jgi:hypothetical protein